MGHNKWVPSIIRKVRLGILKGFLEEKMITRMILPLLEILPFFKVPWLILIGLFTISLKGNKPYTTIFTNKENGLPFCPSMNLSVSVPFHLFQYFHKGSFQKEWKDPETVC